MEYVLLLTWFNAMMPNHQLPFANEALCEQAKALLQQDVARVAEESKDPGPKIPGTTLWTMAPPKLSALCLKVK